MFQITEYPSSGSFIQYLAKITRVVLSNTDYVHVNGHDRIILVILAKPCTRFPDDGPSVIRNMLEQFKYFIILIVSTYYILCIGWVVMCLTLILLTWRIW